MASTQSINININKNQTNALKAIATGGKQLIKGNFDQRTVVALEARGLVKMFTQKTGTFVSVTAKGKKQLN